MTEDETLEEMRKLNLLWLSVPWATFNEKPDFALGTVTLFEHGWELAEWWPITDSGGGR
jgi:hypothetical protein